MYAIRSYYECPDAVVCTPVCWNIYNTLCTVCIHRGGNGAEIYRSIAHFLMLFRDPLTVIEVHVPACPVMQELGQTSICMCMSDIKGQWYLADHPEILWCSEHVV